MKKILLLIFVASASGIFITCRFNFDDWLVIGSTYTCQVTSMNFSDNSTHITGYNGKHLTGYSNSNVKVFDFYPNCPQFNLTTVPKGFLNIFLNFIGLRFINCSITLLNGDELDEYPNLQWFVHGDSNLTRVPGNLFSSTPNMKFVYFSYNKIQHVGKGLLDTLQNLKKAEFASNICINKWASLTSEIPALIESLNRNCPDIATTTVTQLITTISTSTSTNQPPRCEINDFEDFICGLDEEIENLKEKDEKLQAQVENLSDENLKLNEEVLKLKESNELLQKSFEDLSLKNEALETNVEDLKSRNEEMEIQLQNQADSLLQLEQMVIYLSTRP